MESVNRSQAPQRLCELSQVAHLHGLGPTAWVAVRDRRPFLQGLHKKEQKKTKQVWKQLKTSTRVFISAQGNVGKKWNPPCYPVKNIADGFPCVQTCSLVKKWTFSYNKINHLPGGSGSAPFSLWLLKAKKHNPKVMLQLQFCFLSPKKKNLTWHPP